MRKKVLILHGWGGSEKPHWQWYLERKLQENGYIVLFPTFPNTNEPSLDIWLDFLKEEYENFEPDIVVCHSLSNILWFHFVERYDIKAIKKLMLVSPVSNNCEKDELKSFFPYVVPDDLKSDDIIMVGSTNDPYMGVDEIMDLQTQLNIGLKILDNAGHINSESGFGELTCAYDWINRSDN